jgi:NDP-sugar pyrophosphorylase family protein
MQALILAGGRGTRLAPFTTSFPKPLVPVGDRPILHHLIDGLRTAGCRDIVLSVNYLASLIEAYFGDGSAFGVGIRYAREKEPLGTAGPIAVATGLEETFLVLNGDTLSDIDYQRLYTEHVQSGEIATLVSYRRDVPITLGVIVGDGHGHLAEYREKPVLSYEVSTGVYAMSSRVREFIGQNERLDMPDLMLRLLAKGSPPRIYRHEGKWLDVGRVEDYEAAQRQWEEAHPLGSS